MFKRKFKIGDSVRFRVPITCGCFWADVWDYRSGTVTRLLPWWLGHRYEITDIHGLKAKVKEKYILR